MTIRPGNAQHQGAREYQQDAFAFSDLENADFVAHGGVLGVIADGMGGLARGGEAGQIAVRTFLHRYESKSTAEPIPVALAAALEQANTEVVNLARSAGEAGNVGATLVAVVVHDYRLYWTSVGDSRAYLLRGNQCEQLTLDHVYGAELDLKVASGSLTPDAARNDPDREALTSHLGKDRLTQVDRALQPLSLEPGDRVFLCTDGLYRALDSRELIRHLTSNPQRGCEELVDKVVRKQLPGQDNLTAIALALDGNTSATVALVNTDAQEEPSGVVAATSRVRTLSLAVGAVLLAIAAGWWWWYPRTPATGTANGLPLVTLPTTVEPVAGRGGAERGADAPATSTAPRQEDPTAERGRRP
ncbi:MAG: protein phosphatase 2C domain-containing protein [Vicinamibacterales bacterium]